VTFADIKRRYNLNEHAALEVTPAQLAEVDFYAASIGVQVSSQTAHTYLARLIAYGWRPWGSDPEADYNRPVSLSAGQG
jgi:hypothetical protein